MKKLHPSRTINTKTKPSLDKFTVTHHVLLIQFSNRVVIGIEEIAEIYLGLSPNTAKRRAKENQLPFPTFRMGDSNKSPYVVHIDDLANFINERCRIAENFWKECGISH